MPVLIMLGSASFSAIDINSPQNFLDQHMVSITTPLSTEKFHANYLGIIHFKNCRALTVSQERDHKRVRKRVEGVVYASQRLFRAASAGAIGSWLPRDVFE